MTKHLFGQRKWLRWLNPLYIQDRLDQRRHPGYRRMRTNQMSADSVAAEALHRSGDVRSTLPPCDQDFLAYLQFSAATRPRDTSLPAFLKEKAMAYKRQQRADDAWDFDRLLREFALALPHAMGDGWVDERMRRYLHQYNNAAGVLALRTFNEATQGKLVAGEDWLTRVYRAFGLEYTALKRQVDAARQVLPAAK